MTNKERELFEECKLQFIHIHNVIGRKQFSSTKNLIKAIDKALILPVVVKSLKEKEEITFKDWLKAKGYKKDGERYLKVPEGLNALHLFSLYEKEIEHQL